MVKLLELFKGTGSVGKVAKELNWDVLSLDFDKKFNPDINSDILKWDYKTYSKDNNYIPDYIWASPPCNTFSKLAFIHKHRDPKTGIAITKQAKEGTKILHKTLRIINYFKKLNPKLKFIIENPKAMMRLDKRMQKLPRETTLYCLYGDARRKETDFFHNIKNGLDIKKCDECPHEKHIDFITVSPKKDRIVIPPELVRHLLNRLIM